MEIKGAFWKKNSKSGEDYYSGNIEIDGNKVNCVMFINKQKTSDKSPDFTIKESKPMPGRNENNGDVPF